MTSAQFATLLTATRQRLEAALAHARAPHQEEGEAEAARSSAAAGVPASIVESLAEAEERALRELIRAHTAQGNSARAASLKEDYRALLASKRGRER